MDFGSVIVLGEDEEIGKMHFFFHHKICCCSRKRTAEKRKKRGASGAGAGKGTRRKRAESISSRWGAKEFFVTGCPHGWANELSRDKLRSNRAKLEKDAASEDIVIEKVSD